MRRRCRRDAVLPFHPGEFHDWCRLKASNRIWTVCASSVVAACVRMRCCTPCRPASGSAVSTTAAPPDLAKGGCLWCRRVSGLACVRRTFGREIERTDVCRLADVWSCLPLGAEGRFQRFGCRRPNRRKGVRVHLKTRESKPKQDKSGAVILRLIRSPFAKPPSVLIMFRLSRKSTAARGRWRDS